MKHQARSLLAATRRHQRSDSATGYRYPAALRARVLAYVAQRCKQGASLAAVATEVGVTTQTLDRWLQGDRHRPQLRRVVVTEPKGSLASGAVDRPVLVTPSGNRIEGLSIEAVARLLRLLS